MQTYDCVHDMYMWTVFVHSVCLGSAGMHAYTQWFYAILHFSLSDGNVDVTLEDVLVFATGCAAIPDLGFEHQPKMQFDHSVVVPTAAMCGLTFVLPMKDGKTQYVHTMCKTNSGMLLIRTGLKWRQNFVRIHVFSQVIHSYTHV